MSLPPDAQRVKTALARDPNNKLHQIAKALLNGDPELENMWISIARAVKRRAEKSESTKY